MYNGYNIIYNIYGDDRNNIIFMKNTSKKSSFGTYGKITKTYQI